MPIDLLSPSALAEDAANRSLLNNVHPEAWVNPRPVGKYNLVILGGGYAGILTAREAVKAGAKVALVERNLLGGVCLNAGCISSKAMIRTSRLYSEMRNAAHYGAQRPDNIHVDFAAVMERMRRGGPRVGR